MPYREPPPDAFPPAAPRRHLLARLTDPVRTSWLVRWASPKKDVTFATQRSVDGARRAMEREAERFELRLERLPATAPAEAFRVRSRVSAFGDPHGPVAVVTLVPTEEGHAVASIKIGYIAPAQVMVLAFHALLLSASVAWFVAGIRRGSWALFLFQSIFVYVVAALAVGFGFHNKAAVVEAFLRRTLA